MAVKMRTAIMATMLSIMIARVQSFVPPYDSASPTSQPVSSQRLRTLEDIRCGAVKDKISCRCDLKHGDLEQRDDLEQETLQNHDRM